MRIRRRLALYGTGVGALGTGVFVVVLSGLVAGGVGNDQDRALAALAERSAASAEAAGSGPGAAAPLLVADLTTSDDPFVVLVDPTGAVRYATATVAGAPVRVPAAVTLEALETGASKATTNVDGVDLRLAAVPFGTGDTRGVAVAGQPTRVLVQQVAAFRAFLFIALVVTVIVVGIVSWLVTGRAMRPLVALAAKADEIATTGDLSSRLPASPGRDEVGALTTSFNAMLDRLAASQAGLGEALEAQRRFVADASHELRTPLTTIRTSAEFLREQPEAAPEDRTEALGDVIAESERMGALVDGLLLLARSDAGLQGAPVPVDLAGLAVEAAQRYRRAGRDVRAVVPGAVVVAGDRDALARLVANLVENGVRHGAGEVLIDVRPEAAEAVLRVADRGPGFPPGTEARVFERFARLDPARSGPGTGLGLAIARSIAVAHGGSIRATNRDGGGALVEVRLPLA